ncbi:MAG: TlpA family protein disulfide reductase [Actinomycetota bacterium]
MNRRQLLLGLALLLAGPAAAKPQTGLVIHPQPRPLPALDIRDDDGRAAGLESLQGRPVLLNLWASWCGPCVAELPTLDRLHARGGTVAVVALSLDRGGRVVVRNTYGRLGITALPVRTDETRRAAEDLGVPFLPVTLLIDRQGREVARFVGPADWSKADALLDALAADRPITADMAPPAP